ncbi:MAG: NADH-ubiquinone oxidoreductase-F iron-sulfur binding region domain-containing protein [Minisyncoccales bacterium]
MNNIIKKLKKENLKGRSGSLFPTGKKWEIIKNRKEKHKYIICNGTEGEPGVFKDKYILENYPEEVLNGIKIAINTIKAKKAFIYLNETYYKEYKEVLNKLKKEYPIELFKTREKYLAGEETTACNLIEGGKRIEAREKPPYPTEKGLWNSPTLINNIETFYYVSKISKNQYNKTKFYCIAGKVNQKKVIELPLDATIKKVLEKTNNLPNFDFFVQVGGGAAGKIFLSSELDHKIKGLGSVIIYDKQKMDLFAFLKEKIDFFLKENCDRCTPCREGTHRIKKMIEKKEIDNKILKDLFFVMENTSLCPFGETIPPLIKSAINKLQ